MPVTYSLQLFRLVICNT